MSDQTATAPTRKSFLKSLEVDTRLLGMIGAFILVALVFNVLTDGRFLTPRNIFNLTIQTASVAIMATGMVFVIVTRHIDLSVGAVLAACSALMAMTQVRFLPGLGLEIGHWAIPWIAITAGVVLGGVIGAFNGWLIGYQGIPAFIVTLGGFLVWRNVGWYQTSGQTIGPLDKTFMTFGGINGTLGGPLSWALGAVAIVATIVMIFRARRTKVAHGFPVKPMWAELSLAGICVAAIAGFIAILTNYAVPGRVVARDPARYGCEVAEGCTPVYGLPISVLLLLAIAIVMTVIARRTRFGRYIFATGGNPDAAELSGINTRMLTVKIFALMGVLCAISAVVASARLANHSNDLGTLDELRVIAAAVIGGTALSGGIGTIYGAILGALIMQSLQSGMAMVGVDAPLQNIVVGAVLVFAVFIDIQYRKRVGAK
ncbi:Xylose transport system permease protein [Sulfitobacter noctilucicola]|uniref:Xylose transport system permease protein XylH n=1 Tax=Sulfitobacter noctilucicola TaxID=1342301 RepID=A0A7W6Q6E0_9RHOB|nr:sugar ABC transporter permease [Sulfitobacter noctilucicola]KIN63764.1 Xylose transport system permease protein [Sulfitobacter noctilucicola]MBB4174727.1 D-xylose transport system permease protein [Sulfitobacter noctilucicola]